MSSATQRPTGPERWRHRTFDWLLALVAWPLVAVSMVTPGAVREVGGDTVPTDTPSLAVWLFPGLVPDDLSRGLLGAVDRPAAALFVVLMLLVAPGLTAWGILHRRSRPHRLLVVAVLLLALFGACVPAAIALYSFAAWFADRRLLAGWSAAATVALAVGMLGAGVTVVLALAGIVTPLALGLWRGTNRQLLVNLRERAAQLEREQQLMAERAAVAERTRIAREMHDIVAHRVSLMVVHAGGLEVSAAEPGTAETAGLIRDTGREALAELREVLGVLHDGVEAPTAPQPTLADLPSLLAGWRAAGMAVTEGHTGDPGPPPQPLSRTAYRVVQEALTNAAKHAPGSPVWVRLDHRPDMLTVEVVNSPPPPTAAAALPPGGGHGLTGLRERVALAGGELTCGEQPDGSWRVHATLPVGGHDPAAVSG